VTSSMRAGVAAALGTGVLTAMLLVFLLGGTALPLHLGNVGSFLLATSRLEAEGFRLTPDVDRDSGTEPGAALPAGYVTLQDVRALEDLRIDKAFDFSALVDGLGTWTVSLSSPSVRASGLGLHTPHLCAASAEFRELGINGITAASPADALAVTADGLVLTDASIEATQLDASTISLPGLELRLTPGPPQGAGACLAG